MLFRVVGWAGSVLVGTTIFALSSHGGVGWGMFGPGGYARTVDRPQAQVMAAVEDMALRDPAPDDAAGPVTVSHESRGDQITWTVDSDGQPVARMTASFAKLDEDHTRVTTAVETIAAPDGPVPAVYRDKTLVSRGFAAMVDGEINKLVTPYDPATCASLRAQYESSGGVDIDRSNLVAAMGSGTEVALRMGAVGAAMRRRGCDGHDDETERYRDDDHRPSDEPAIVPGRPMSTGAPMVSTNDRYR